LKISKKKESEKHKKYIRKQIQNAFELTNFVGITKFNRREISFMISWLERSLKKNEEDTIKVVKLLLAGKTIEQISDQLEIPVSKVIRIKNMFESDKLSN
jgi:hypothetical protein